MLWAAGFVASPREGRRETSSDLLAEPGALPCAVTLPLRTSNAYWSEGSAAR